jgi:hypothetical protein
MKRVQYKVLIGSFIIAGLFWISVTLSGTFTTEVTVPLTVSNMPADFALAKPLPENVELSVQGTGWQLLFLLAGKQVVFDIPGYRLHSGVLLPNKLISEAVKLPAGVLALQVYPETLLVSLDQFVTKRVPLTFNTNLISYKEGYGLNGTPTLSPDSISLKGAERVLRKIISWPVETKPVTDCSGDLNEEAYALDSLPGIVSFDRLRIQLRVPVQQLADIPINDIPVTVLNVPPRKHVQIEFNRVQAYVRGGVNLLSTISVNEFKATVEYQTLSQDSTGYFVPKMQLPKGLVLLKLTPPQIRFSIRAE